MLVAGYRLPRVQHWLLNTEVIHHLLTAGVKWQQCEALWVLIRWMHTLFLILWSATGVYLLARWWCRSLGCLCLEAICWSLFLIFVNFPLQRWQFALARVLQKTASSNSRKKRISNRMCLFWGLLNRDFCGDDFFVCNKYTPSSLYNFSVGDLVWDK